MSSDVEAYHALLNGLVGDDDPLVILERTPASIGAAIAGVDPALLRRQPAPGKWSVGDIVAHLADAELVFGHRLRLMMTSNGTPLQAFDPDRFAATFNYGMSDVQTSLELFASARRGNLRWLRTVPESLYDNTGTHDEWGSVSVRSMVRLEAGHDLNHLSQITRIVESPEPRRPFRPQPQKPEIAASIVDQVDLRVGTIVGLEDIPGAARLVKLRVDFGADQRTVIAGLKDERHDPRGLIGRQALFYYNLPRKSIRGHVSEAMLCDAGYADGILPALLQPEWLVPNGTQAG